MPRRVKGEKGNDSFVFTAEEFDDLLDGLERLSSRQLSKINIPECVSDKCIVDYMRDELLGFGQGRKGCKTI